MAAEGSRRGLGFRRSGNGRGGKQNGRIRAGEGRRKKNRTAFLAGNRKGACELAASSLGLIQIGWPSKEKKLSRFR
jgi:hypothetical protein